MKLHKHGNSVCFHCFLSQIEFHKEFQINMPASRLSGLASLSDTGLSSLGVHPQFLAHQSTLSQPGGGQIKPPHHYWHPQIFRSSDGPVIVVVNKAVTKAVTFVKITFHHSTLVLKEPNHKNSLPCLSYIYKLWAHCCIFFFLFI